MESKLRDAIPDDAAAIARIYNHYVASTIITFEEEAVSETNMHGRIADILQDGLPWIVAVVDGELVGYAYASRWRVRPAYRFSVESTVYLDPDSTSRGLGSTLYAALIDRLKQAGRHLVIGGIALPNDASVALHEKMGFNKVGHFSEVGRKFDRWLDVGYWELRI